MEAAAGFTNFSYGQNARFLNQTINKLRECGSEEILGEMPKIAVIGNQSAGKSSLIEAMSGIRVPRQFGTCTRCPMEVVLTHAGGEGEIWKCQISLRIMYDGMGTALAEPQIIQFGGMLNDPKMVEKRLRGAQEAILRMSLDEKSIAEFLRDDFMPTSANNLGFSRNVVRLDVFGPDLVDVTFIDLPGIISNSNKESVHTIRALVEDFIKQPDCLILVAISMSDDIENQGAAQLARKYDEKGERTIGVLTKADTVMHKDVFKRWVSIVSGEDPEHILTHGYYLTMQNRPNGDANLQKILEVETKYFEEDNIWLNLPEPLRNRTGSTKLREKLSFELSRLIGNRIPGLIKEVNRCTKEIRKKLEALPQPVGEEPQFYLEELCTDFEKALTESIKGQDDERALTLMIGKADKEFLEAVRCSIPQFGLADSGERRCGFLAKSANDFFSENSTALLFEVTTTVRNSRTPSPEPDSDFSLREVTPSPSSKRNKTARKQRVVSKPKSRPDVTQTPPEAPQTGNHRGEYFELEELYMMVCREKLKGVPGSAHCVVHDRLIRQCVGIWGECAQQYFAKVFDSVRVISMTLCKGVFSRFERSGLYDTVRKIILESITTQGKDTVEAIYEQIRTEYRLYTQHNELLGSTAQMLLKCIMDYRRSEATSHTNAGASLVSNEYKAEFDLISNALAYLRVACIRFADAIPMRVQERFQSKLVEAIKHQRRREVFPGDCRKEKYKVYLEDDPQLVAVRQELTKKLEILKLAELEVRKFRLLE